jgi:hypothetical protein
VPMGMVVARRRLAVMMGPMVLVWRWNANSSKELYRVNQLNVLNTLALLSFGSVEVTCISGACRV